MLSSIACHDMDPLQALFQSSSTVIPVTCSQEASQSSFDWSDFLSVTTESQDTLRASFLNQPLPQHHQDSYISLQQKILAYKGVAGSEDVDSCWRGEKASRTLLPPPVTANPNVCTSVVFGLSNAARSHANTRARRVRFSDVLSVRQFDITLGDHPLCMGGLAIGLDWSYRDEAVDFELFERVSSKRRGNELRMSYCERRDRLREATGCTGAELLQLEYDMTMTARSSADDTEDVGLSILHGCPSVERALMAAQGFEDGYERIV